MVIKTERKIENKKNILHYIAILKKKMAGEAVPFEAVFLFGSYATGAADKDSDIDIAIVVPSGASLLVLKKIREIPWWAKQINVKLEPHVISSRDFRNQFLLLPSEIKKHGVKV